MEQLYFFRSTYDEKEYLFKNKKEFKIFFKEWVIDFFDHLDYMPEEEKDFWTSQLPIMTGQQAIEDCIEP